jgi:dihydropteroate synthase
MTEFSVNQSSDPKSRSLRCGDRDLDLSCPQVMAVLNVTPDSFSDGGSFSEGGQLNLDRVLRRTEQVLKEGASIVDVGGESTRPGAQVVSLQEEIDRVLPVIEAISERFETVISVDSSSPKVMSLAAAAGANLINDVRALEREGAVDAVKQGGLPVCLMHMQGQPSVMQHAPQYQNVVADVNAYLQSRLELCVSAGISKERILLDPGFGFGKSAEHNLQLLNRLPELAALGCPLLVGLSRKSLIGVVLGREVSERLAGSVSLAALAVVRGASIIRAHDIKETVDAVRMAAAMMAESVHC